MLGVMATMTTTTTMATRAARPKTFSTRRIHAQTFCASKIEFQDFNIQNARVHSGSFGMNGPIENNVVITNAKCHVWTRFLLLCVKPNIPHFNAALS